MSTAREKFQGALLALARSGHIKDRLAEAYRNHLADLAAEDLPEEIRADFHTVSSTLTREPPLLRSEDALRATLRKMSNDEAESIAHMLVRMFAALPPGGSRHTKTAQVIPLYLAEARSS
ncbi:MAG TPA: hypothetical protein VMG11_02855 [Steroidobacteraceae bacterium]|nr:hypothetical protein [Steroidobacteraceae bacterium]